MRLVRGKKITFFSRTFWTNEAMKMSSDWGYSLLRRKSEILRQEDFDEAPRAWSPRLIPVSLHFGSCIGCWDEMKRTVDCVPVFLCRWHWCQHGQSGQWKRMSASVGGCLQRLLLGEWHCKIHWKLQEGCDPQDPPKCRLCKKKKSMVKFDTLTLPTSKPEWGHEAPIHFRTQSDDQIRC